MELIKNTGTMAAKREAMPPPAARSTRNRGTSTFAESVWRSREWRKTKEITNCVSVLTFKLNHKQLVVMKVMRIKQNQDNDPRPLEIRALSLLPDCNRILKPLHDERLPKNLMYGMAIFAHCPLGDLKEWKESQFDEKRMKAVPESFMWRFFIHIAQALTCIHNELNPRRPVPAVIHRDIKPKNIMVVENGTTYPSFKLHDFGLAMTFDDGKTDRPAYCGTYEWQPPENPIINTRGADVWSLGACVHYLATGMAPLGDYDDFRRARRQEMGGDPPSARVYSSVERYYTARVPREVTTINVPFRDLSDFDEDRPARQYSDELNDWMKTCLRHAESQRPTAKVLLEGMLPEAKSILKKMGGASALVDLEIVIGA